MPPSLRTLLLSHAFALACCGASAGVAEGDFLGYRLGSKYPITQETRGYFMGVTGSMVIMAERPEMPPEFVRVELIASPKTYTIINIFGVAEFAAEAAAKDFARQYAELLNGLHRDKCRPMKAFLDETLKLLCSLKYELSVSAYAPDKSDEKHKVHIGLRVDNDSTLGKRMVAQFRQELTQVERDAETHRLEKARSEKKLKGIQ